MTPLAIGLIGLVFCFILIFLKVPIAFAFGITGLVGLWYVKGLQAGLSALSTIPYATVTNYAWTAIPMFVMMGYLAQHTKLAEEFYQGVRAWVGHFRGGLAGAVILGNTGFGACSGDSLAAAATFTTISLPEMRRYKYSDSLTLGSIAAGSLLAQLIPPSFALLIYGALTTTSITKLFIAGIIPGLILAALYIALIYFMCRRNPALGPPGPKTTWRDKMMTAPGMWAVIALFVVIIGGLYLGLFTPTEAGACGAFVVFVLGLARRKLSWHGLTRALVDAGLLTAMVGFLVIGCLVFNLFLVVTKVHLGVGEFIGGLTQSPIVVLFIIVIIFFFLGMVMDVLALVLLLVPILFPLIQQMNIDPVHFGVVLVIVTNIGTLSPPFGIIVYALGTIVKDVPLFAIFRAAMPFIIAMVILELLVIFFPQISLFLPNLMM